jgi:hypothetical protein
VWDQTRTDQHTHDTVLQAPCAARFVAAAQSERWNLGVHLIHPYGWYGGATPQPQRGTGACSTMPSASLELCIARRVPHSA